MKSLTDVVSGAGLSVYAEIALVIFLIAFVGIVISLFAPSKRRTYEHLRRLPIDEDTTLPSLGTIAIPPFVAGAPLGRRSARDDSHAILRLTAQDDNSHGNSEGESGTTVREQRRDRNKRWMQKVGLRLLVN